MPENIGEVILYLFSPMLFFNVETQYSFLMINNNY